MKYITVSAYRESIVCHAALVSICTVKEKEVCDAMQCLSILAEEYSELKAILYTTFNRELPENNIFPLTTVGFPV